MRAPAAGLLLRRINLPRSSSMSKPRIGITIGDPSGIGPEITEKTIYSPEILDICVPVVIGLQPLSLRDKARQSAKARGICRCAVRQYSSGQAGEIQRREPARPSSVVPRRFG